MPVKYSEELKAARLEMIERQIAGLPPIKRKLPWKYRIIRWKSRKMIEIARWLEEHA